MSQAAQKRDAKPAAIKDAAFDWEDPLDLEGELTEEERMVRDTARGYAQDKLFPRVLYGLPGGALRSGSRARDGRAWLARADHPGGIRRRGPGLCRLWADHARDRARRIRATAPSMSVQSSLVMHPIFAYGSEAQRKKYLPKLASGEWSAASA